VAPCLARFVHGGDLEIADCVTALAMTVCRDARVLSVFVSRFGKFVVLAPERTPAREAS
jgi:cytochrome c-type biogenesis protein CcmH/NrfF